MNFNTLLDLLGNLGWFDLATAVQISSCPRKILETQLHRWCKSGKLIPLRRGMYAFAENYRHRAINPAQLANHLYTPSYLSTYWALGFYGLIPEKPVVYTSVTARVPRKFNNAFGNFMYRHVKATAFFGYHRVLLDDAEVLLAEPEKALLDLWHLESGKWSRARMEEMRFQNVGIVDTAKLADYAERFVSPRLVATTLIWNAMAQADQEGTVEL